MTKETKQEKIDFIKKVAGIEAKPYLDKHGINRVNFTRGEVHESKVNLVLEDVIKDLLLLALEAEELKMKTKVNNSLKDGKGKNKNGED